MKLALITRNLALVALIFSHSSLAQDLSNPSWFIPPNASQKELSHLPDSVEVQKTNVNLAIKHHNGRLYVAFRTAPHHHTRPPMNSTSGINKYAIGQGLRFLGHKGDLEKIYGSKVDSPVTRMYVVSAEVSKATLASMDLEQLKDLNWDLEFEVNQKTNSDFLKSKLQAIHALQEMIRNGERRSDSLAKMSPKKRKISARKYSAGMNAKKELKHLLGDDRYRLIEKENFQPKPGNHTHSLVVEFDIREPLFVELNGKLFFYYLTTGGYGLDFQSIRTWATQLRTLGNKTLWTYSTPILTPEEHAWDIKPHQGKVYLTSYKGAHYERTDKKAIRVFFKESKDGLNFSDVGGKSHYYEGGATEASFEFDQKGNLVVVMRLDDGDPNKGWGTLVAKASKEDLSNWQIIPMAIETRHDSPRLFRLGEKLYLVARQNIWDGDESKNAPYDLSFKNKEERNLQLARRKELLQRISQGLESNKEPDLKTIVMQNNFSGPGTYIPKSKEDAIYPLGITPTFELTYWSKDAKRTALYELTNNHQDIRLLKTLPSAGDTAFPSVIDLGDGIVLIANYSNEFQNSHFTWAQGQHHPSGVYFIRADFNRR